MSPCQGPSRLLQRRAIWWCACFRFSVVFQFEKKTWRVTLAAALLVVHYCVGFFCVWLRYNAARCFVGDSVRRVPVLFPFLC